jgi:dolichol-phosphate mannosyltransferase
VCAGIDATHGRAVIVMDGDLQDPPEVFEQFIERWRAGYEVVFDLPSGLAGGAAVDSSTS